MMITFYHPARKVTQNSVVSTCDRCKLPSRGSPADIGELIVLRSFVPHAQELRAPPFAEAIIKCVGKFKG